MALFGNKESNDSLSHWARLRDAEDDGFMAISRAWSMVKARWGESLEGKVAVACVVIMTTLVICFVIFLLNNHFPTFDPSR